MSNAVYFLLLVELLAELLVELLAEYFDDTVFEIFIYLVDCIL